MKNIFIILSNFWKMIILEFKITQEIKKISKNNHFFVNRMVVDFTGSSKENNIKFNGIPLEYYVYWKVYSGQNLGDVEKAFLIEYEIKERSYLDLYLQVMDIGEIDALMRQASFCSKATLEWKRNQGFRLSVDFTGAPVYYFIRSLFLTPLASNDKIIG